MKYDVWFCRHDGDLYTVIAKHDEPPISKPRKTLSVGKVLNRVRIQGHTVAQVGILPPDMIGLDVEV